MARGDETVSAVVAGPSHDGDPAAGRMPPHHGARDGRAGIFHERDPGHARGDGGAIGGRHLLIGKQFDHRGTLPRAGLGGQRGGGRQISPK